MVGPSRSAILSISAVAHSQLLSDTPQTLEEEYPTWYTCSEQLRLQRLLLLGLVRGI